MGEWEERMQINERKISSLSSGGPTHTCVSVDYTDYEFVSLNLYLVGVRNDAVFLKRLAKSPLMEQATEHVYLIGFGKFFAL